MLLGGDFANQHTNFQHCLQKKNKVINTSTDSSSQALQCKECFSKNKLSNTGSIRSHQELIVAERLFNF